MLTFSLEVLVTYYSKVKFDLLSYLPYNPGLELYVNCPLCQHHLIQVYPPVLPLERRGLDGLLGDSGYGTVRESKQQREPDHELSTGGYVYNILVRMTLL